MRPPCLLRAAVPANAAAARCCPTPRAARSRWHFFCRARPCRTRPTALDGRRGETIQVLVSNGTCTLEQINGSQCSFISSAAAATAPKPRVITVKGVAAGTYQVYVGNRGPKTESVSIQVGLTTGGAASSSIGTRPEPRGEGQRYTTQVTAH